MAKNDLDELMSTARKLEVALNLIRSETVRGMPEDKAIMLDALAIYIMTKLNAILESLKKKKSIF